MCTIDEGKDKDVASSWIGIKNHQTPDEDLWSEFCRRTCSQWAWGEQQGEKKIQDRLQLVRKCNCYTHLLHKCCMSQSVQLKFSAQIRKKSTEKNPQNKHILKHSCAPWLFYCAEIRWLWGCVGHNMLGVMLQETVWDDPGLVIGRVNPAGRSTWMRCGHTQTDMISNDTQAGAFKLSSTVTAPTITAPLPPSRVDTFMFYVVYTELWSFTCCRINHDSNGGTLPLWANLNGVSFLFSVGSLWPFGHDTDKNLQKHSNGIPWESQRKEMGILQRVSK